MQMVILDVYPSSALYFIWSFIALLLLR